MKRLVAHSNRRWKSLIDRRPACICFEPAVIWRGLSPIMAKSPPPGTFCRRSRRGSRNTGPAWISWKPRRCFQGCREPAQREAVPDPSTEKWAFRSETSDADEDIAPSVRQLTCAGTSDLRIFNNVRLAYLMAVVEVSADFHWPWLQTCRPQGREKPV